MEERLRGEPGFGEWCIHLTELGTCSCEGCGGHLVGEACLSCGCRHGIQEPTRHTRQRYATRTPNVDGRCSAAGTWLASWDSELDQQARQRRELG